MMVLLLTGRCGQISLTFTDLLFVTFLIKARVIPIIIITIAAFFIRESLEMINVPNTSYYEYFPGGSRDIRGTDLMGLLNPPLPQAGYIQPPDRPGWGAEWDWDYFEKKRVAVL